MLMMPDAAVDRSRLQLGGSWSGLLTYPRKAEVSRGESTFTYAALRTFAPPRVLDDTIAVARRLGITVFAHKQNLG